MPCVLPYYSDSDFLLHIMNLGSFLSFWSESESALVAYLHRVNT